MSTMTAQTVTGWRARLTVDASDMSSTSTMSILRQNPDGSVSTVIGADRIKPQSGVFDDPEVPLGAAVGWTLQENRARGDSVVSPDGRIVGYLVAASRPVLSDPFRQLAARVIVCTEGQDHTMAGRASSIDITGRASRVWSWDVEGAPTLSPILITDTPADHAAIEDIMSTGDPVLLRTPCATVPDRWLMRGGDRSWSWLTRRCVARKHTLSSCEELAGAPAGATMTSVFGDTLKDLYRASLQGDAAQTTLGQLAQIAATWDTLGAIASTDLKAR